MEHIRGLYSASALRADAFPVDAAFVADAASL